MTDEHTTRTVVEFYDRHPINERQILDKLQHDGHDPKNITEDVLQNYDQDHFGGVAANDTLAALVGIAAGSHVLDVCCGLGGPSRYLAANYGCRLTGMDLAKSRIDGARRLTELTGLHGKVDFQTANALAMPFDDAAFDILISQEAFCHVPDKSRLIGECVRVLKPGGRLAFTDIVITEKTADATLARLEAEMTFQDLASAARYRALLEAAGCTVAALEDLSAEWRDILVARLAMYRSLKDQTVARFGEPHFEKWDSAYSFFVAQYQTGELGGVRLLAHRPPDPA